jgi:hypothetical protein
LFIHLTLEDDMRKLNLLASAAILALGFSQSVNASITPSTSGTNAAAYGEFGGPGTIGDYNWSVNFTVEADANPSNVLTVQSLGIYATGGADLATPSLNEAHNVALYQVTDGSGAALSSPLLLASTTVPAGTAADAFDGPYLDDSGITDSGFYYENISPITLTTGATYAVEAYNIGGVDKFGSAIGETSVGTDLTFADEGFAPSITSMDGPESGQGYTPDAQQGLYGAGSFGYTIAPVPEPTSIGLLAIGGLMTLTRRRRTV